jgi:ubiquitin carboxyl-terminal hydrolase 47
MTEYCESSATTNNNTSTAAPEKLSKELEESLEDKEVSEDNKESNKEKKKKRVFQPAIDSSHDSNQYQLFAVIIHSGGAYGGHYHTYIRDFNAKSTNDEDTADDCIDTELRKALKAANADAGVWYDFNDSTVRQIPIETIASQYGSSKESACMLRVI